MNQWWKKSMAIGFLLVLTACATPASPKDDKAIPFSTIHKQLPKDGGALEQFGYAVALSDDVMVVGSPFDDSDVDATNGTVNLDVGSAYLLQRDGHGVWTIFKKLTAKEGGASDLFGSTVAISGDTIVVGALYENHDTNGDGSNEANVGAAYVFERNNGGINNWGQVIKLVAEDGSAGDRFGRAVAIDGDTIVIGAYLESHDDDNGSEVENAGAAYVFERHQGGHTTWGEVKKLVASDGAAEDNFGHAVAVSKDSIVVGAHLEDHNSDTDSNEEETVGAAYVFGRNQGGTNKWSEIKKLVASDGSSGDHFGVSIAINEDTVVIGAYLENFDNTDGLDTGAAYLFRRNHEGPNAWGEIKKLVASDSATGDRFGFSVAISRNIIVVGAYLENHDTNGDGVEELNAGAAYIFEAIQGATNNWREVHKVTANKGATNEALGFSVAVSGRVIGVGVPLNDNAGGENAGAVYIYK
jgi:FG-GAP repeat